MQELTQEPMQAPEQLAGTKLLVVCRAEGCHSHLMEFSWAIICSSVGLELASGAGKASSGVDVTISVVFCSSQLSPGAAETLFTEV